MPKYLVSLSSTTPMDGPDPNFAVVCEVIAVDRREAVRYAAQQWANRHMTPPDVVPGLQANAIDAILEGFDCAMTHDPKTWQPLKGCEWIVFRFNDSDDGHEIDGYVVRITEDVIRGVNVTA